MGNNPRSLASVRELHIFVIDMIRFAPLLKRYQHNVVLDQPILEMGPGIHILVGKNGTGKTSLLRILSGYGAFIGEGLLNEEVKLGKDHQLTRRQVRLSEAEPTFPDFVKGQYLVDMFQKLLEASIEEIEAIKKELGIESYLQQPIGTYSSGMKKKLSLLLAFIGQAQLILLDEPFNTLDPPTREQLCKLIDKKAKAGCSFLLAMHQPLPSPHPFNVDGFWAIHNKQVNPIDPDELSEYFHHSSASN